MKRKSRSLWWSSAGTAALGLLSIQPQACNAQVTWGMSQLYLSETDDVVNQRRLHDLLRRAYFSGYSEDGERHSLWQAIQTEISEYRNQVQSSPALALGVGMAKYHFSWYIQNSSDMNLDSVEDAANLMYLSIQFNGCHLRDLPMDVFVQRMCNSRWPYTVLMYSELGREFASRYLTDQAATILERAVAAFDEMKRLPYYASRLHWQGPYDINFNEEWFPGVMPWGPVWNKDLVPFAQFLENNFATLSSELGAIVEQGLFDRLHFQGFRAEGQDSAPDEGWRAVELKSIDMQSSNPWSTPVCQVAPQSCALLASRPELNGCLHTSVSLVRLRAGGRLKPHFGVAPKLQCHLALRADPGARMSVGNQTLAWKTGEAIVFDDTFVQQEWHAGVRGDRYVLQVTFCHPCEDSQRSIYNNAIACPASRGSLQSAQQGSTSETLLRPGVDTMKSSFIGVPFAAAALWSATLPELAPCNRGINELCPPDTQHGGANPLSAVNTWNYALNNLKAAVKHSGVQVDPALVTAIAQVQGAIQSFLGMPALDQFGVIVSAAVQIFEVMLPWLQQQPPANLKLAVPQDRLLAQIPSDGKVPPGQVVFPLSNGVQMPAVGFGTWKLDGTACYQAVLWALELGIRHIDTAEAYGNEADIGRAIKESGVQRSDLFISTKATSIALGMADPSAFESIFAAQLMALGTDYVDVYMVHAAGVKGNTLQALWKDMERMYDLGRIRALGVSNFGVEELEELWSFARVKPVYLQNIFKIYKQGEQLLGSQALGPLEWAHQHQVTMMGYSAINSWPHLLPPLQDPHVLSIAAAHSRTASQVLHRWALQHGVGVIPKASSKARIAENMQLFDFELTAPEMALLDGLATLSESTDSKVLPPWRSDVFALHASTA